MTDTPFPPRTAPSPRPVRVLQFGGGNFLRAFADWMIDIADERGVFDGDVQIVQRTANGRGDALNAQDGQYTVIERGLEHGEAVTRFRRIGCVRGVLSQADDWEKITACAVSPELRYVVSNTTEAGIEYRPDADTFPGRVARLLTARCAAGLPGLVFLPCELIEANGEALRACVLRYLDDPAVRRYVETENLFCNTLVDRIVSGFPPEEEAERYAEALGFRDAAMVAAEVFHQWVIEIPEGRSKLLPDFARAGLNVILTDDLAPYRTRKVRLLNGAHTSMVAAGLRAGLTCVGEAVRDPAFGARLRRLLFDEIAPTLPGNAAQVRAYAASVLERFANPAIAHRLSSIALNSISKWRVRVLPSLKAYCERFGAPPPELTAFFAELLRMYRENACVSDTPEVCAFFGRKPELPAILAETSLWGENLNQIPGFGRAVKEALQ